MCGRENDFTRPCLVVVILAAFIIIVPQNLYHTISADDFVTYMGCCYAVTCGWTSVKTGKRRKGVAEVTAYLETDSDVSIYCFEY